MTKCEKCRPAFSRRSFLRFSLGAGAGIAAPWSLAAQQTVAKPPAGSGTKSVILLWMGGGPSQLDTFDPKPGSPTQGEFKAIDSAVRGMQVTEHLPIVASQMKHLSIIRSVVTREGDHDRGEFLLHTGMSPNGLEFPATGTVISYELGRKGFPLPHFVSINQSSIPQSSIFGEEYLPFRLGSPDNPIPNLRRTTEAGRAKDRSSLLAEQSGEWAAKRQQREVEKVQVGYAKSEEIMSTPLLKAFDYRSEPEDLRKAYGTGFGTNCLLARRLVEAGCAFVEIGMGGWDTHVNNFDALRRMLPSLDAGMGTLVRDLAEKNLLQQTMVVWCGEFGRTPRINGSGRDHWTQGFSVVMGGGGIQGGRVVGDTGPQGLAVVKRPVPIQDLFATLYRSCGLDPEKRYVVEGRKVKYAYNGKPVSELF